MTSTELAQQLAHYLAPALRHTSLDRWPHLELIQETYRQLDRHFLDQCVPPAPTGGGRGIVTLAGGKKYFCSLWVLLNQLRQLGCTLPVEVWYLHDGELDLAMRQLLRPFALTLVNIQAAQKRYPCRGKGGWELKAYAIRHSRFQEVLFLDADNAPVVDPSYLFETPEYQEHGAIFWPDFPHRAWPRARYEIFDLPVPATFPAPLSDREVLGQTIDPAWRGKLDLETGQMLIDKGRCWRELELAGFYSNHADYYFDHSHGDCSIFLAAWEKLGGHYALPLIWPDWDTHTIIQHDMQGQQLFEHRTNPKYKWALTENAPGYRLQNDRKGIQWLNELQQQWPGQVWGNVSPSAAERAKMQEVAGPYHYHWKEQMAQVVVLPASGEPEKPADAPEAGADLTEVRTVSWSLFRIEDTWRLVIRNRGEATCFLYPGPHGTWIGHRLDAEQAPVVLAPADTSELPGYLF